MWPMSAYARAMWWRFYRIRSRSADVMKYGPWRSITMVSDMPGRMGTGADSILGPDAFTSILGAADAGLKRFGLTGDICRDDKGTFRFITGAGDMEVGMAFVTEGSEVTESILSEFLGTFGDEGILMVIDHELGELTINIVESGSYRPASCLMSE